MIELAVLLIAVLLIPAGVEAARVWRAIGRLDRERPADPNEDPITFDPDDPGPLGTQTIYR